MAKTGVKYFWGKFIRKIRAERQYKDRFFRTLFGNDKKALLEIYNALNGTEYTDVNELEIVTIESAIFVTYTNDVSFVLTGVINLYEHQSTVNPNMPVRFLIYLAEEYSKLIARSKDSVHSSKLINLPAPKFVVFYNGDKDQPDEKYLKLSDAYINKNITPDAELTVRVLNVNYGHNKELMDKCKTLSEYSVFVEKVNEYKNHYPIEVAINMAIEYCIEHDVLADFLSVHEAEVLDMLALKFDRKKYDRNLKEEGKEEGREEGREEGKEEGIGIGMLKLLICQIDDGKISIEDAAEYLNITSEEFATKLKIANEQGIEALEKIIYDNHLNS